MKTSSHTLDRLEVAFDDPHAVANAGLLLSATLAQRLRRKELIEGHLDLGERVWGFFRIRSSPQSWSSPRVPGPAPGRVSQPPARWTPGSEQRTDHWSWMSIAGDGDARGPRPAPATPRETRRQTLVRRWLHAGDSSQTPWRRGWRRSRARTGPQVFPGPAPLRPSSQLMQPKVRELRISTSRPRSD